MKRRGFFGAFAQSIAGIASAAITGKTAQAAIAPVTPPQNELIAKFKKKKQIVVTRLFWQSDCVCAETQECVVLVPVKVPSADEITDQLFNMASEVYVPRGAYEIVLRADPCK